MFESDPPRRQDTSRWRLPHTLTLLPTYGCTAACHHCCFQSNPTIKHRIPQDRLLRYIDEAAQLGTIRLVCFSGGEAFLLGDDLVECVERCAAHGFITRIVTNGYWATSGKAARRRLEPLIAAGLNEINFSTGDDHVQFVQLEHVLIGMDTAIFYGLTVALMIEETAVRRISRADVERQAAQFPTLRRALENNEIQTIESPWMEFAPDGSKVEQAARRLVHRGNLQLRRPCTSIYSTVVVTPSENLGLCCGLPREQIPDLNAGNLRTHRMADLIESTRYDFLKMWLLVDAPEKILAWAASKDPDIQWENKYAHICDACRAIYSDPRVMGVITKYYEEKYDEVLFRYALFMEGRKAENQIVALGFHPTMPLAEERVP
ncbi:MAG: radical SAM protein [Verrucomicrobiales bacterium]|nr:radical SAM protein [Verrucomicrobiales bacterium]